MLSCNSINNTNIVHRKKAKTIIQKANKQNNDNNKNQIKSNVYNSFINSPSRLHEKKHYMNSQTKFQTLNKKNIIGSPKKGNSLTKPKRKEKEKEKTIQENKESKIKRQLLYSKKIINNLTNQRLNQNNDLELRKNETIQVSSNNLKLDVIFEDNINEPISHRYLQNTVSRKNKMVTKKNSNTNEHSKNNCNNAGYKTSTLLIEPEKQLSKKTLLRLNKTPKAQKIFKERENIINNDIDNNIATRNRVRKSFYFHRELSIDSTMTKLATSMSMPKIFNGKIDDYLITKELGKGSYAVVKLAVHKLTKNKYAIKIYSKQSLIDPQKRNVVKNEINILKQIDNENVMKLYEVIDTSSNLYLVLEYINGVNLLEILKKEKDHYIKEERAKKIFLQVVNGISYCHKKNIFHRDIKLENILVLKDDTIKIIDFGFGVKCNRDTYQKILCGTPSYMPPEILKKEKYIACYGDVWSLGVLFYSMLYGVFPFRGKNEDELIEQINENKIDFPDYNQIEDKTKELFSKIFVLKPDDRISLDEMINILS